jgi:CubicO group peptidase (beta-lactamase class C family)
MAKRKIIKRSVWVVLLAVLVYGIYYAWRSFPIISGYSAKNACSCLFIQHRDEEDVKREELGDFPLSLGSIAVDWKDASITGSVWGLAKRKAIYRKGFGCTLVNDFSESSLRSQTFDVPQHDAIQSGSWPFTDSIKQQHFNKAKLDSAFDYIFSNGNIKNAFTHAALVLYDGQLVAEKYAPGYTDTTKFLGWSVAKSIMGALTGILVKEGRLTLTQPAPVPQWSNVSDKRHGITVENLLQQTSGLDFREDYAGYSEVTNMLFNKGDMATYVADLPLKYKPGSVFYYSSGNTNLLSGIIRRVVGEKEYHSFPYTALFYKLGMYHTLLEPDASGTYVGSSYIYASARDYVRFALLYYNDGVWNGERILPEGWVQKTITPPAVNTLKNYGYQFWLNGVSKKDPAKREYPDVPADMYYADGYGGQDIYIIPSKKIIVVRVGLHTIDENGFLKSVIDAFQ